MHLRNTFLAFAAILVATSSSPNQSIAQTDFGTLNPAAPPETAQFAFIVGKWDCSTRFLTPTGELREGHAQWTGSYILDGWAIQDVWVSERPTGPFYGLNIRSFNEAKEKWDNRWLPQGTLEWVAFESEMVGETMVMTGGGGTDQRGPYIDRNTFSNISEDSWSWRKDRSWDGGKTWFEGIGFIEATRVE